MENYEQKYKDGFSLAREWYDNSAATEKEKRLLEAIYPDLKESEDGRIRKWLLDLLSWGGEIFNNTR